MRKSRIVTDGKKTLGPSDYGGQRRINFIYERALKRFPGDVALWLQYMEHVKEQDGNRQLSKIYVRALQLHPRHASFWILAAEWEFVHNANVTAARTLFQRGIRMNETNPELWLEYHKLEIAYVEKLHLRSKILGLGQSQPTKEHIEEEDGVIRLPQVMGEDMRDTQLASNVTTLLHQQDHPLFSGQLLTVIYEHAIIAIPNDYAFRLQFAQQYALMSDKAVADRLRKAVLDNVRQHFEMVEVARVAVALAMLKDKQHAVDYVESIRHTLNELVQVAKQLETAKAVELTCSAIWTLKQQDQEAHLARYLAKALEMQLQEANRRELLSPTVYLVWMELLKEQGSAQVGELATRATDHFSSDERLWKQRILHAPDNVHTMRSALQHCPASTDLWLLYLNYHEALWKKDGISDADMDALLLDALKKATAAGSKAVELRAHIQKGYLEWRVLCSNGIQVAQALHQAQETVQRLSIVDAAFLLHSIDMELRLHDQFTPDEQKTQPARIQALFKRACHVQPQNPEPWLACIQWHLAAGHTSKAVAIYQQAERFLTSPTKERFAQQYQSLIASKQ